MATAVEPLWDMTDASHQSNVQSPLGLYGQTLNSDGWSMLTHMCVLCGHVFPGAHFPVRFHFRHTTVESS